MMKPPQKSYISSSIVGRLFDLCRSLSDEIPGSFLVHRLECDSSESESEARPPEGAFTESLLDSFRFSLDSNLRYPHSGDFVHLAQRIHDSFLAERGRACVLSAGTESSFQTDSGDISEVSQLVGRLNAVTVRFKRFFHEIVIRVSTRLSRPPQAVSCALASAVYEISYMAAIHALEGFKRRLKEKVPDDLGSKVKEKSCKVTAESSKICKTMLKSLQVPWLICGHVLNEIKSYAVAKQRAEHLFGLSQAAETPFDCITTIESLLAGVDESKLQ